MLGHKNRQEKTTRRSKRFETLDLKARDITTSEGTVEQKNTKSLICQHFSKAHLRLLFNNLNKSDFIITYLSESNKFKYPEELEFVSAEI